MARRPQKSKTEAYQWYKLEDENEKARSLFDYISYLEREQRDRNERNIQCLRLYGNVDYVGMGPYQYSRSNPSSLPENRVKMNIISSMVDTVAAKVSKMKPRVTFLTEGGQFDVQQKAKKLQKFVFGAFIQNDIYVKHQAMFKDSCIFDIGAVKHYIENNRICSERVLPTELLVDVADAMYGDPSQLFHVKYIHKDTLCAAYPEDAAAIRESSGSLDPNKSGNNPQEEADYVIVIEAWKKPSKRGGKDGRHTIAVEKAVLKDEKWKHDFFPFTFDRWSPAVVGWYGQSLADRLTGNQVEINKMLRVIQRSFHLGSAFKVFLEYGSKVAKEHVNNDIGSLVYYTGVKPEFYVPQTVHPEFFRHLEWLIRSSYEEAGVSQLSAASKIPSGMDGGSGKALREYNDLETERFVLTAQEYEASFLQTARIYIELVREQSEKGKDIYVVAESKRFIETIKWSEVAVEDNEFIMQMFPTSMLPATPAGRLAYVQELIQAGFVDKLWGLSLLEFPDVEGYTQLEMAPLDDILNTLDQVLYKGEFSPPEPFQNLELGVKIFHQAYLRAKIDNAPEDRLELVRRWILLAQTSLTNAQQAAQISAAPGTEGSAIPVDGAASGAANPAQQEQMNPASMQMAAAPAA